MAHIEMRGFVLVISPDDEELHAICDEYETFEGRVLAYGAKEIEGPMVNAAVAVTYEVRDGMDYEHDIRLRTAQLKQEIKDIVRLAAEIAALDEIDSETVTKTREEFYWS